MRSRPQSYRPGTSVPSPSPRTKFLFTHLADPTKAPVRGPGRSRSEVGRMLRKPAGAEDVDEDEAEDDNAAIDPVLRNILGIGTSDGRDQQRAASSNHHGAGSHHRPPSSRRPVSSSSSSSSGSTHSSTRLKLGGGGGIGAGRRNERGGGDEDDDDEDDEDSGSSSSSSRRHRHRKHSSRHPAARRARFAPDSPSVNLPPRGTGPLRTHALSYMQLMQGGGAGSGEFGMGAAGGGGGGLNPSSAAAAELDSRILRAARAMESGADPGKASGSGMGAHSFYESDDGWGGSGGGVPEYHHPHLSSYATRRAAMKRDRERKVQARLMDMVHRGTAPPELLLDEDLERSALIDADTFENDPDAYDTDELLGSDAETIASTDEEDDTPELAFRRLKLRERRRRQKVKALRKRKRQAWAKKRADIEAAKSRYYDDMIDQLVVENPMLRPPPASVDLETKRAFVDRATAENATRSKIDQMASWIRVISIVVENVAMMTGLLMLDGLSAAIETELAKPSMQPILAQLARKYLRRGPSSPEWSLAIVFIGTAGVIHASNVRRQEASATAAGQGNATGPASSKLGRMISGGMGLFRSLGFLGPASPPAPAADSEAANSNAHLAAATISQRYANVPAPHQAPATQPPSRQQPSHQQPSHQQPRPAQQSSRQQPPPRASAPPAHAPRPPSGMSQLSTVSEEGDTEDEEVRLDAAPWEG